MEDNAATRPGLLMVLSAPLGIGKRTLCQAFLDREPETWFSISRTTRPRAPREVEGHDFYFVSESEFKRQVAAGELMEHIQIHGHFYGTPRVPLLETLARGRDVLLDIDTEGARAVKKACPEAVLIFVCPPDVEALKSRLTARGVRGGDPGTRAREEILKASDYDYVVLSESLVETAEELSTILRAERRRAARVKPQLAELLESFGSVVDRG